MALTWRHVIFFPFLIALFVLAGCDEDYESGVAQGDVARSSNLVLDRSKLGNRRVAETHIIHVETPHERIAKRFYRDLEHCIRVGCELMDSVNNPRATSYIKLRIEPEKLPEFLTFILEGPDKIRSHELKVEDKTQETIDVDARVKNLELLRERLRNMLSTRNGNLRDVLAVEKELAELETKMDAARAKMRVLQSITQKATVHVFYQQPYHRIEVQYYKLKQGLEMAEAGFIQNLGDVIAFTGTALPWVPLLFFFGWLFVTLFKVIFLRKPKQPVKQFVDPPASKASGKDEIPSQ